MTVATTVAASPAASLATVDNTWAPRLREELVWVQKSGDEGGALWDPVINRRVNLGAISRAIITRLDGSRGLRDVLDDVAGAMPDQPRSTVEHTFRSLMLMNLVEGSGKDILARAYAVRTGRAPFDPVVLDGSRFQCQGSGECCQNYTFGPLAPEDIARIEALDIRSKFPLLEPPYFVETQLQGDEGDTQKSLATVDDRCVFLEQDRRCGLHRHFGAASKPGFCRLYPLQPLPTIDGLKVYDRGECASFAASARDGAPLEDQLEAMKDLLPQHWEIQHPIVFLDDETPCDYGHFLALQRSMVALVEAGIGTASETLAAVSRLVGEFNVALRGCTLRRGQPDDTAAAILRRPAASFYLPLERPSEDDWDTLAWVAGNLLTLIGPTVKHELRGKLLPVIKTHLASEFAAVIHLIQALATHRAQGLPLPLEYRKVVELPVDGALLEEVLRLTYRQRLFGHQALVEDRPLPALVRLAFVHLITLVGGKLRASIDGATSVEEKHLSFAHMLSLRVMRSGGGQIFRAYQPNAFAIVEAAAQLL